MSLSARTNIALLILRVGIGLIALYYGLQQVFGLFGGVGYQKELHYMHFEFNIPPVLALLAMAAQLLGGLGMVVGMFTNLAAFGLACTMAGATYEEWRNPALAQQLFSHGNPQLASEAFYAPALFFGAFAVMMMGAGSASLDGRLFGGKKKKTTEK